MAELSLKQQRFAEEYLLDGNGTQAALRAGYAQSGAGVQAERLLKNANVLEVIKAGQQKRAKKRGISASWVLKRLIHESKTAEKDAARVKALELVGKHLGMFTEKLELTGKDGGPIEIADITEEERARRVLVLIRKYEMITNDDRTADNGNAITHEPGGS